MAVPLTDNHAMSYFNNFNRIPIAYCGKLSIKTKPHGISAYFNQNIPNAKTSFTNNFTSDDFSTIYLIGLSSQPVRPMVPITYQV